MYLPPKHPPVDDFEVFDEADENRARHILAEIKRRKENRSEEQRLKYAWDKEEQRLKPSWLTEGF